MELSHSKTDGAGRWRRPTEQADGGGRQSRPTAEADGAGRWSRSTAEADRAGLQQDLHVAHRMVRCRGAGLTAQSVSRSRKSH